MAPETLRGRLALYFGVVLAVVLFGFSATVYIVAVVEPDHGAPEDAAEAREAGERLLVALFATLPLALGAGVGGALILTRSGLRPLVDVVNVAERMGLDRLDLRVPLHADNPREVAHLSTSMNAMLQRLETSVAGLHRFTGDAAHELRTPIARVITGLETTLRHPRDADTLRTALVEALEETQRMSQLVDGLLTLSRADAGELAAATVVVDLGLVVEDVAEAWAAPAAARHQTLDLIIDADARQAMGDPMWIARAVSNLVENACKCTQDGGHISVTVRRVANGIAVKVEDNGPGVAAADRERIFERFFRSTSMRGSTAGFGLGLSLARDIAHALGGNLVVEHERTRGAGFTLTLRASGVTPAP